MHFNGTYTFINDMSVPNGVSINDWDKETREGLYVKKFIELGGSSQGCVILSKTSTVVAFRKVTEPFYTKKLQITNVQYFCSSCPRGRLLFFIKAFIFNVLFIGLFLVY